MQSFQYVVQPGDSLISIAKSFGIYVYELISLNQLQSHIFVGQKLYIPSQSRAYLPVTAYTADRPILVNGVDINKGAYPILNYQPPNTAAPYIYVPIAEFRRVGALVRWDDAKQIMVVESDYDQLKSQVAALTTENQRLQTLLASYQPMSVAGNTSGNLTNWGIAAKQGDWVYFSNITNNYKLYKMRLTGESKTKLNEDDSIYINVVGDWIYYVNRDDQMRMYKIRIDGTQRTRIDPDHAATMMVVSGDWIYYATQSEQYRLYKIKTDGTSKTRIGADALVDNFYVQDEWIYYTIQSANDNIFRIKTDGTQRTQITQEGATQLNVVGPYIYYVRSVGGGIFRINQDGSGLTQYIVDIPNPSYMNVWNDWIYYGYSKLMKRRIDAAEQTDITPVYGFGGLINVIDEWIYLRIQYNGEKLFRMKIDGTQGEIIAA